MQRRACAPVGEGQARGEGRQGTGLRGSSVHTACTRGRAHTVLGPLFSSELLGPCLSRLGLALRTRHTAVAASPLAPQSTLGAPRTCSMHRQEYSICEVKQLRGPDDLVYTFVL